ncbi:MAG TPA: VOC family protein [Steroidobacter sp.]|jgi:catechol 2,3-dioxygenase-like lactoylglutathione lyase family enzyme|nr:VOC family protein [Steroidobacteraceae bacterium]HLS80779.1 VOC family protein [Steroidobacter sp.]
MRVDAIDHLHLLVPDLEKTKALFTALIGGDYTESYGSEDWNVWSVWYTRGGMEIMQPRDPSRPIVGGHRGDRMGVFGMAFRVGDLDAAIPGAQALGLKVRSRMGSEEAGFGKWIVQAQFETRDTMGVSIELAQRQRPDDPLYSAFRELIDHVELYVHDLPRAVELFSALTGWEFPTPARVDELEAITTMNGLGVKITQPLSAASPVAASLASRGEGVRTLALTTPDLEVGVAMAQAAGLRLTGRGEETDSRRCACFDPEDTFGLNLKLVEL